MDFGVAYFPTDESVEPATLARMAEERGFESVFVTEHTHIPASRETSYPAGGDLPREYWRIYDPFVALTTMAAATERTRVGTAICLVIERDPIITAKEVASLDRLSGGRFLFGVGAGWNVEEMRNHGTDPRRRFSIMRERVEAMKAIWTQEEAEYHGEHVDFDPHLVLAQAAPDATRRSWSAEADPRCLTGCSPTATSGCPTACLSRSCRAASRSCSGGRARPAGTASRLASPGPSPSRRPWSSSLRRASSGSSSASSPRTPVR